MKRICTWDAKPAQRNFTAVDIRTLKGKQKLVQTTANTAEQGAAAADAGIDLIMGNAHNTAAVREGSPQLFFTAAVALPDYPTEKDVLETAFAAMKLYGTQCTAGISRSAMKPPTSGMTSSKAFSRRYPRPELARPGMRVDNARHAAA